MVGVDQWNGRSLDRSGRKGHRATRPPLTAPSPRAHSGSRGVCSALPRSDEDRPFGRRLLPVVRRPMDARSSRGHTTGRLLLHGQRSAVVRRRVGLRGTTSLVGKTSRRRLLLACLCWSLCGRPARRSGPVEDHRRWLAMDGRAVVPGRRRPLNRALRLALKTSVIFSSPCCYFCSRWADAATSGSSGSPCSCSFGPTYTGAFYWA